MKSCFYPTTFESRRITRFPRQFKQFVQANFASREAKRRGIHLVIITRRAKETFGVNWAEGGVCGRGLGLLLCDFRVRTKRAAATTRNGSPRAAGWLQFRTPLSGERFHPSDKNYIWITSIIAPEWTWLLWRRNCRGFSLIHPPPTTRHIQQPKKLGQPLRSLITLADTDFSVVSD